MSMWALLACSASLRRIGTAAAAIWLDRALSFGTCSATTLYSWLALSTILTCTTPNGVCTGCPVTVDRCDVGAAVGAADCDARWCLLVCEPDPGATALPRSAELPVVLA